MGLPSDQTRQVLVVMLLYSCLPLFRLAEGQLIRSMNADACDDIICPGGDVQYDCSVPISGSVVVWRMMPECERNGEQPDIIFLFRDPPLSIVCNDGRKITVQGIETSNRTRFVSTLNVTNITTSQTTECLFDDGSQEEPVGNNTVFTTAPARIEVDDNIKDLVITLDQVIENCTYAVNTSTDCGMCGIVVGNTVTCTNVLVGSECTVEIETQLCRIPVNIIQYTQSTTSSVTLSTTSSVSLSTTSPTTQKGSLSQGEIAAVSIVSIVGFAFFLSVAVIIAVIVKHKTGRKHKTEQRLHEGPSIDPVEEADGDKQEVIMDAKSGLRVIRGPNWNLGDQDGGEGHVGTVVEVGGEVNDHPTSATVLWDSTNNTTFCKCGREGKYELRALDIGPAAEIEHNITCNICNLCPVYGFRWKCTQCHVYDLCTACYMKGHQRHLDHVFTCYAVTSNYKDRSFMQPRKNCRRVKIREGGEHQQENAVTVNRSRVNVQEVSKTLTSVYIDHLPVLGKAIKPARPNQFSAGDQVKVAVSNIDTFKKEQNILGIEWTDPMNQLIGKTGAICRINDSGSFLIDFNSNYHTVSPLVVVKAN